MNSFKKNAFTVALVLFSNGALAADLYVNATLKQSALKGLEVEIDGEAVGATGANGGTVLPLTAGEHRIRLTKNGVNLGAHSFTANTDESLSISFSFASFGSEPKVTVQAYEPGATAAANGFVQGQVLALGSTPVAGATVRVEGTDLTVTTDEQGYYDLELPAGRYSFTVTHPGYNDVTAADFEVLPDVGVAANVSMTPVATDDNTDVQGDYAALDSVVVVGTYNPLQLSAQTTERESLSITDTISIDDLLRQGDSDLAASLKRLVGVSIADGKYAVVRGLDGRYISSTLNGALMPTTDPFRRDVQLDLFPPGILGGVAIQKSFSADLPGDTTGGIIKISTLDEPKEYINKLSFSLGYTTDVTGEKVYSYQGGDTDFLGIDDGTRELPGAVDAATNGGLSFGYCQFAGQTDCVDAEEGARLATLLPNNWQPATQTAGPGFSLSYALGNQWVVGAGALGAYGSVGYGTKTSSRIDAQVDDLYSEAEYARDTVNTSLNAYGVVGYDSDRLWNIRSKTLILRETDDTVQVESGFNKPEEYDYNEYLLEWVERQLVSQQLEGGFRFFDGAHSLNWRAGLAQTSRYSPDRRTYLYREGSLVPSTVERSYNDLTEDSWDLGADYALPIAFPASITSNLTLGATTSERTRDVELVRLGIADQGELSLAQAIETLLAPENFENDAFRLRASSASTDSYTADQSLSAVYLGTDTALTSMLSAQLGVRYEAMDTTLNYPNATTEASRKTERNSEDVLPNVGLIYRPVDSWQLRAGYSATVSRPNLTELSPSRYFDERGRLYNGCPTCEDSTISNYDFRAEYYFSDSESVSFALFLKEIDQPLETSVADASGSASGALVLRNNDSATLTGVELDFDKYLLESSSYSLKLGANLSYIDSKITLSEDGQRLESVDSRELQGQSPWLANLQLSLDHYPLSQKATLLVNYFDDRIDAVGAGAQEAIYEVGRVTMNFNYEKEFANESSVSFKAKNLLDTEVQYEQSGQVIESWREGIELSIGYSIKF